MDVGQSIRRLRQERGLRLEDLAAKAGISPSYLSEVERGKKKPSLKTLDKLAAALNLSRESLVTEQPTLSLGDRIRRLRQEKELTLTELARRSGLSATYLEEVERGGLYPAADTLARIASALGVPTPELVSAGENWIGGKLKEVRESLGLTQVALAAKSGLSAALISQIEAGKVRPSLKTVEKLADALGISPCYLLTTGNGIERMLASVGPDLRELLLNPNVQAVLRSVCHLNQKQLRFLLRLIEVFKDSQLE